MPYRVSPNYTIGCFAEFFPAALTSVKLQMLAIRISIGATGKFCACRLYLPVETSGQTSAQTTY